MKVVHYVLIMALSLVMLSPISGQIDEISLNGTWQIRNFDYGMGTWKPAWGIFMAFPPPETDSLLRNASTIQVPGSVQQALVDQGVAPDPYIGDNIKEMLWVEEQEWWLVKSIDIPIEWAGMKIALQCNMLNYQADVWVNQNWSGRTIGNYSPMDLEVLDHLNYGASNDIVIRLRAPENSTNAIKNNLFIDWRILNKEVLHERPWVTPSNPQAGEYLISKCFFGWDWGPHLVPIGILQPIKLQASQQIELASVFVKTMSIDSGQANLSIDFNLTNEGTAAVETNLHYEIISQQSGKSVVTDKMNLSLNPHAAYQQSLDVIVNDPELWWPNNYGDQNLYTIKVRLVRNGKTVAQAEDQFGIRTLEKVRNEDSSWLDGVFFRHDPDEELIDGQYNWTFRINGVNIFIQGMNSIPMDAMLDLSPEIYQYTLRCAANAHVNMLRVWGEGLYETNDFYNICDQLGILVWQDFWVGSYSPAQPQESSWDAVIANIKRTRNHPSLVLYCGGNE